MNRFISQRRYWPLSVLGWGVLVWFLFIWNQSRQEEHVLELARERAEFVARLVEATRMWAARHGGVYAPTTETNPPNEWLEPQVRQVLTSKGVELTLINPSYLTRQLGVVVSEYNDLNMRLTSLEPLNPENQADAWEHDQLQQLNMREKSHSEQLLYRNGEPVFRYLAPLLLEKPCQQCHTRTSDVLGSLRGGISLEFPVTTLFAKSEAQMDEVAESYVLIWLLLSGFTLVVLARLRSQLNSLNSARIRTEEQVRERTAELAIEVHGHQQAAAQLRLFIDSSGEGIIAMDMKGDCTLINPKALQLLGYQDEQEFLGQSLHERIHHSKATGAPHNADACPMHETITIGHVVHQDDDVFWRADGSSFPVEYRSNPLYTGEKLIGAVINFSDISSRKAREQRLEKLSSALEQSPSTAVITSAAGVIEYVNPHFVKTTGYSREEVLGKNPRILQSGQTPRSTYEDMWLNLNAGKVWDGELINKKKDGSLYWEHARISPIEADNGEVSHFIAIKEDITERKMQERMIWEKANFDALTGLSNRSMMQSTLEQALLDADAIHKYVAVLYLDLDGFKGVNDNFGHAAGDQVLIEAAHRIQAAVRNTDSVSRLGGDEFVVILGQLDDANVAEQIAGKIVERIGQVYLLEGKRHQGISASLGVALYPMDAEHQQQLIEQADRAMYKAKQAGGNRWERYKEKDDV